MLLRLQPYNTKIIYRSGIEMKITDYLTRTKPTRGEEIELDLSIHTVNISAQKQADLKETTKKELKMLSWLVVWVLWYINLCRLFNAQSIFIQIIISILNNSV